MVKAANATPRKPRVSKAPADETKEAKFSRLASARVTKAVKAINNIANLANRSYVFTQDQADAIDSYLDQACTAVADRFKMALSAPSGSGKAEGPTIQI